jgi:hypothetical protein
MSEPRRRSAFSHGEEPTRWKDAPDAPIGMRELLGSARPTRPLDELTFRRNAKTIARLSVAPAAAAATISIWTKLAAAGAIGLAATGAVVAVEMREMQTPAPEIASTPVSHVTPPPPASVVVPIEPAPTPIVESCARVQPSRLPFPCRCPSLLRKRRPRASLRRRRAR